MVKLINIGIFGDLMKYVEVTAYRRGIEEEYLNGIQ
jgi:hypothetical protein